MNAIAFPADFRWCVATSAQQIEGAFDEDGRSESIWDRYAATPANIADRSDARIACDHYHRWRADFELLRWLGVGAYRFSIAWPRVLPAGTGAPNAAGLDFYDALVDALLASGIEPFVTLFHWDLPQVLQERGGWMNRQTVDAFVEYADVVSRRLGDRVKQWTTHNEPWCISHLGYEEGVHAPGLHDPAASLAVAHHLLLSHGRAVEVLRRNSAGAQVGIVLIQSPGHPVSDSAADRDAARQHDGAFNRWFLDPLYRARYPEDAIADRVRRGHLRGPDPEFVRDGDLACIATPTDYLGVNYYSRVVVRAGPDGAPEGVRVVPERELTAMGWEIYPAGLTETLLRLHRDYAPGRLYVTENGAACGVRTESGDEYGCRYLILAPGREGDRLVAEAREESQTGRSGVYAVKVRNQNGENIAVFQGLSRSIGGAILDGD